MYDKKNTGCSSTLKKYGIDVLDRVVTNQAGVF